MPPKHLKLILFFFSNKNFFYKILTPKFFSHPSKGGSIGSMPVCSPRDGKSKPARGELILSCGGPLSRGHSTRWFVLLQAVIVPLSSWQVILNRWCLLNPCFISCWDWLSFFYQRRDPLWLLELIQPYTLVGPPVRRLVIAP